MGGRPPAVRAEHNIELQIVCVLGDVFSAQFCHLTKISGAYVPKVCIFTLEGFVIVTFPQVFFKKNSYPLILTRLLEMRMPRTSSFSVRDILDLPQIKPGNDINNGSNSSSSINGNNNNTSSITSIPPSSAQTPPTTTQTTAGGTTSAAALATSHLASSTELHFPHGKGFYFLGKYSRSAFQLSKI